VAGSTHCGTAERLRHVVPSSYRCRQELTVGVGDSNCVSRLAGVGLEVPNVFIKPPAGTCTSGFYSGRHQRPNNKNTTWAALPLKVRDLTDASIPTRPK
jgi:hypothetical protein